MPSTCCRSCAASSWPREKVIAARCSPSRRIGRRSTLLFSSTTWIWSSRTAMHRSRWFSPAPPLRSTAPRSGCAPTTSRPCAWSSPPPSTAPSLQRQPSRSRRPSRTSSWAPATSRCLPTRRARLIPQGKRPRANSSPSSSRNRWSSSRWWRTSPTKASRSSSRSAPAATSAAWCRRSFTTAR